MKNTQENITVNGVEYTPLNKTNDIKIIVAQRGWVFVGRYRKQNDRVFLDDAYCIRVWGTSKGLGELTFSGPLKDTKLDKSGTVELHELSVVCQLTCEASAWNEIYK